MSDEITVEDVLHALRGHPDLRTREAREGQAQAVCRQLGKPYEARYAELLAGRPPKAPPKLSHRSLKRLLKLMALAPELKKVSRRPRAPNVIDFAVARRKKRSKPRKPRS